MQLQQPTCKVETSPGRASRDQSFGTDDMMAITRTVPQLTPDQPTRLVWVGLESIEITARVHSSLSSVDLVRLPARPSMMDSRAVPSSLRRTAGFQGKKATLCQHFMLPL